MERGMACEVTNKGLVAGLGSAERCPSTNAARARHARLRQTPGYLFGYVTPDAVLVTFYEDRSNGRQVPLAMERVLIEAELTAASRPRQAA